MDAVTKLNHFWKCGHATKDIPPLLALYFAEAEAEIRELEADGKLNLRDYVDSDALEEEIRICYAELHCARAEAVASTSGPCDIHGVVGAVCKHGFPLIGAFMDMWGPEQYIYYLVLLKWLTKGCAALDIPLGDVYVDFGCRLVKTWERYLEKKGSTHLSTRELEVAKQIRVLVNWMHGSSHELSCQLQSNGRYTEGAGHQDGEGTERLWSHTKVSVSEQRFFCSCI